MYYAFSLDLKTFHPCVVEKKSSRYIRSNNLDLFNLDYYL